MDKKVSIIVPVYNTEAYLHQCIGSILNQTYKNIELLLITEPCDDNSERICDSAAAEDSRIRVFHKPTHSGVSSSRNIGIRESIGDFILFVDSDDYIEPQMIESLLTIQEKTDADIIKCRIKIIEEQKNYTMLFDAPFDTICYFPEAFQYILGKPNENRFGGHIASILIPKEKIVSAQNNFILLNESLNYSEDIHWIIRILLNCKSIYFCKEALYCYRRSRSGNTYSELYGLNSLKYSDSAIQSYSEIYNLLTENKISIKNNAYWRLINHKIRAVQAAKNIRNTKAARHYSKDIVIMLFNYVFMEKTLDAAIWSLKKLRRYLISAVSL